MEGPVNPKKLVMMGFSECVSEMNELCTDLLYNKTL